MIGYISALLEVQQLAAQGQAAERVLADGMRVWAKPADRPGHIEWAVIGADGRRQQGGVRLAPD